MANDLNQCNFIGNLGADPETRYTPAGDAVTSFRIAVGWKSAAKEGVEWVSVVAWRNLGEACGEYLKKGSKVFVSGQFQTEKWQDKDGKDRYSTKINARQVQFLDSKSSGQQGGEGGTYGRDRESGPSQQQAPAPQGGGGFEDDIPFNQFQKHSIA